MTDEIRLRDMSVIEAAATLLVVLPIVALLALAELLDEWIYDRRAAHEDERKRDAAVNATVAALNRHGIDSTWSRWLSGEEEVGEETIRCLCDCGEEMDLADHPLHRARILDGGAQQ